MTIIYVAIVYAGAYALALVWSPGVDVDITRETKRVVHVRHVHHRFVGGRPLDPSILHFFAFKCIFLAFNSIVICWRR